MTAKQDRILAMRQGGAIIGDIAATLATSESYVNRVLKAAGLTVAMPQRGRKEAKDKAAVPAARLPNDPFGRL